jgi:hypothetical protein
VPWAFDALPHQFQTFSDSGTGPSLARSDLYGTLAEHRKALTKLNDRGAGIYFTVNETDGKGRRKENVTAIRAVFIDFDTVDKNRSFNYGLPASQVVESSPGKHHVYWLLKDCPLDKFTGIQKRLAVMFGGDKVVHDLPRVMRVPGFYHMKDEPFMVRVVEGSGKVYGLAEFESWLSSYEDLIGVPEVIQQKKETANDLIGDTPTPKKKIKTDLTVVAEVTRLANILAETGEGERNLKLNTVAYEAYSYVRAGRVQKDMVDLLLLEAADACGMGEGDGIERTMQSAWDSIVEKNIINTLPVFAPVGASDLDLLDDIEPEDEDEYEPIIVKGVNGDAVDKYGVTSKERAAVNNLFDALPQVMKDVILKYETSASYEDRNLTIGSVMFAFGAILSDSYRARSKQISPAQYFIIAGQSGIGKSGVLSAAQRLIESRDPTRCECAMPRSEQGLISALRDNARTAFILDEGAGPLAAMTGVTKGDENGKAVGVALTKVRTLVGKSFAHGKRSDSSSAGKASNAVGAVQDPTVSVALFIQPGLLKRSLSLESFESGLLGRVIPITGLVKIPNANVDGDDVFEIPDSFYKWIDGLTKHNPGWGDLIAGDEDPGPAILGLDKEADDLRKTALISHQDARRNGVCSMYGSDSELTAFVNRRIEMALGLSIIYQIGMDPKSKKITRTAFKNALDFVTHYQDEFLESVAPLIEQSQDATLELEVLEFIKRMTAERHEKDPTVKHPRITMRALQQRCSRFRSIQFGAEGRKRLLHGLESSGYIYVHYKNEQKRTGSISVTLKRKKRKKT